MSETLFRLFQSSARSLWMSAQLLAWSALVFSALALVTKRGEAVAAARRAAAEIRVNLAFYFLDVLLVVPPLAVVTALVAIPTRRYSLQLVQPASWAHLPPVVVFLLTVFIGDFVSYWRHRLEHTPLLWPAHAIHHSDTEMTWLTLARFHPINRLTTDVVDIGCLTLIGFPEWAIVANVTVRHYYGQFIHADLPWTLGPLDGVLVSPVMHRWHHARDVTGTGSNFATVFSVFDRLWGTYYVPGPCTVPLGVTDAVGPGTLRQLIYPFAAWFRLSRE